MIHDSVNCESLSQWCFRRTIAVAIAIAIAIASDESRMYTEADADVRPPSFQDLDKQIFSCWK